MAAGQNDRPSGGSAGQTGLMHVRLLLAQHLFAVAASLFAAMQRASRERPFNATYPGGFHTELSTRHIRVHTSRGDAALDRFMWSPRKTESDTSPDQGNRAYWRRSDVRVSDYLVSFKHGTLPLKLVTAPNALSARWTIAISRELAVTFGLIRTIAHEDLTIGIASMPTHICALVGTRYFESFGF